jgi:hypothetical protein
MSILRRFPFRQVLFYILATLALARTASAAVVKVACVGDSITASSSRYPTWLRERLGSALPRPRE